MTKSRSYIATPPGSTIKEQLENRGMSQKEFSSRMGMSEKHISHLINGTVQLSPDVANRLEMVLGLPAKFWNNLEAIYREKLAKAAAENAMDADAQITRRLPYKEMAESGWVPVTRQTNEKVIALRKFFEVAELTRLEDCKLIPGIACRRQAITEKADYALIAWAQRAKLEARDMPVSPINLERLTDSLPQIRKMTTLDPDEFCPQLVSTLADCGLALVLLPHIGGSFLHGATFIDMKKIVIGLTVRGKTADKFWFSLFHEIGHILLGHLNPNGTSAEDEQQADEFARELLIPSEQFNPFIAQTNFATADILHFANQIGIAPGIVVGRLQKEGYIGFSWHNDLKVKYRIEV